MSKVPTQTQTMPSVLDYYLCHVWLSKRKTFVQALSCTHWSDDSLTTNFFLSSNLSASVMHTHLYLQFTQKDIASHFYVERSIQDS